MNSQRLKCIFSRDSMTGKCYSKNIGKRGIKRPHVQYSNILEKKRTMRIDAGLSKHIKTEKEYWVEVLKRVDAVISFLAERGLVFRGDSEIFDCPANGNYMSCLELLAKFDPFLQQHNTTHGNPVKGHVSYLSSRICDEFIEILASSVHSKIVDEIKAAKYYGLSNDSTPDIAHIDQLTRVLRYCLSNGTMAYALISLPILQTLTSLL